MESKLPKQISNYCRLNFSNELIKEPRPIFYPKNIPQTPLLFRKKCQKKSLKSFNTDKNPNPAKNPEQQPLDSRKNSLRKDWSIQSPKDRLSNEKNNQRIQFKNQTNHIFTNPLPEFKSKSYKSLQRQPLRRHEPKRNIIYELKNHQLKIKQTFKKAEPIYIPPISKFLTSYSSTNLNKSANLYQTRLNVHQEKKIPVSTSISNEKFLFSMNQVNMSHLKGQQNNKNFPVKHSIEARSSNLAFSSPLKLNRIPVLEKTPMMTASEPQLIKKASQNINFTLQKNAVSYSEKFNKIFGEVDIEDGLKEDLIASIEFQPMRSHLQNKPVLPSFIKQPDSEKSTFINSESKMTKLQCENDFFDTIDLTKRSQFGQPSKTQSNIKPLQTFSSKNSFMSPQMKKIESLHFEDLRQNQVAQKELKSQEEFRQQCEKRQNFRSIISVHSECETSSESEDSIIIDNHPKEVISARPIRTLF